MDLFRKKDIGALRSMAQKSGLTKNLSAFDLVFLGIGSVIGTGIFVLQVLVLHCMQALVFPYHLY